MKEGLEYHIFNEQDVSHRTWRIRSTWTQSSPDAVEVPASSSVLSETLPPPPPASSPHSAAAIPRSAAVSRCRRLFVPVPPVAECLFVMAEEMGPKNDVVLDAGSTSKTENVPIQVTSIRLTKDNYLSWSAALEIGITSHGRLSYITGDKPAPSKSDPQWATWALEDSQVKVWIISSVSSDIQPLILRKPTSFDMWTVLAKMYGRKKRHLRTYQIKRSIYSLKQGDLSVAAFYAALKTKWEELDYHVNDEWKCGSDHSLYWEKEWMDRTFLFLGGLRDEFEPIRSQILNGDEIPGIEEVYARVESEEQRRQVMHLDTGHGPSAFVSRASGTGQRPARRCTHCNKLGHSVDFCWDIHPEKRLVRGRPPSGKRSSSVSDSSQSNPSSGTKSKLSPDQFKELQAYISPLSKVNLKQNEEGQWYVDSGAATHVIDDADVKKNIIFVSKLIDGTYSSVYVKDARTMKTFTEDVRKGDMYAIEEAQKVSKSRVSDSSFPNHSEVNITEVPGLDMDPVPWARVPRVARYPRVCEVPTLISLTATTVTPAAAVAAATAATAAATAAAAAAAATAAAAAA
ncbi:hypothetical protein EJ110_NYTH57253 [Nymphaea thermarum]|nr:hypothetical protein EJ110_NYTH57253 [Nymphaea thermarum]